MSATNDGGPAFPFTPTDLSGQIGPCEPGMSLRAYFAGQALAGLLANTDCTTQGVKTTAINAVRSADALIAELAKEARP